MPIRPRSPAALLPAVVLLFAGHTVSAEAPVTGEGLGKIGHIVVIFEENRSFDSLFGRFLGANGLANAGEAARQVKLDGTPYDFLPPVMNTSVNPPVVDTRFPAQLPNAPFQIDPYVPQNVATGDLIHRFYQEQVQIDGGKMDKYAAVSDAGGLVMGNYDFSHSIHWRLAQEFTLADNAFHTAFGGSMLNHSFFVCACAFAWPNAPDAVVAKLDAAGNMQRDGQVSPDGFVINTSRSVLLHAPTDTDPSRLVPPQTMPHIGDRLDAAGISWAWYSGGYNDAVAGRQGPRFEYHHSPMAFFADLAPGTPGQQKHLGDLTELEAAIAAGTLPQVVFYKPIAKLDLHPGYTDLTDGDQHLGDLVARLQATDAYKDMLIVVTYDENGGLWDHVAPPKRDRWGPGTRVPLIAIGPGVKRGFVDHTRYDLASVLKTIEDRFGLQPLNEIDGNAASLAALLQ